MILQVTQWLISPVSAHRTNTFFSSANLKIKGHITFRVLFKSNTALPRPAFNNNNYYHVYISTERVIGRISKNTGMSDLLSIHSFSHQNTGPHIILVLINRT